MEREGGKHGLEAMTAQTQGWIVLEVIPQQVKNGEMAALVEQALAFRKVK